jgi:sulfate/thiosulfate transport system ATP-binding protein
MTVHVQGLGKRFGAASALDAVDLWVDRGEFVALLGPSGSGKTTLLRIIAGLDEADAGTLEIDGRDARGLPPRERGIGFVFQHYALFRHMSVAQNIAFGLQAKPCRERPSRADIAARVGNLLSMMQLEGLGSRFPAQLSGGQRQRVALARALAVDPALLLLDEPFGALDAKVRIELREWLRELQRELGITTLFVTHDQDEALQLADRVAILNAGRIEQIGTPAEVYDRPASPFVTEFLGAANRFEAEIRGGRLIVGGAELPVARRTLSGHADGPTLMFVRSQDVRISDARGAPSATVRDVSVLGARRTLDLVMGHLRLRAEISREEAERRGISPGSHVPIELANVILFPARPHHRRPAPADALNGTTGGVS